jgi:para-nitrobenzyl esterase
MPWLAARRSLLVALAASFAAACTGAGGTPRTTDPAVVRVSDGALKGQVSGDVRTFVGIPYAAPPMGPLAAGPLLPGPGTRRRATSSWS